MSCHSAPYDDDTGVLRPYWPVHAGIAFTPIANYPEVAIVGINKFVERPAVVLGCVEVRTLVNLSSAFDHRVVDGWDAAAFIQAIKQLLQQPATLFMDEPDRPAS